MLLSCKLSVKWRNVSLQTWISAPNYSKAQAKQDSAPKPCRATCLGTAHPSRRYPMDQQMLVSTTVWLHRMQGIKCSAGTKTGRSCSAIPPPLPGWCSSSCVTSSPFPPAHLIHYNKFCNISALWISTSQDQGSSGSCREEVAGAWSEEGRRNHFSSRWLSDLFSSNTKLLSGSFFQAERVFQREQDWCSLHERNGGFQTNLTQGQAGIVNEESAWPSSTP